MATFYFCLTPLQPPYPLGRDDNGCWTYAFNVEAWKQVAADADADNLTLEEVASYLETQGLTSLFRYVLPDRPNTAIALTEYPGRPGEGVFGTAGIAREYPRFQVQVRGEPNETVEPRQRAQQAYVQLGQVQNQTL